jgi:hypothetical protein
MVNAMFVVSETEAAAIRAAYDQGGEFSAAIELRRLFPGIADNDRARDFVRTIAGWKPSRLHGKPRTCPIRTRSGVYAQTPGIFDCNSRARLQSFQKSLNRFDARLV